MEVWEAASILRRYEDTDDEGTLPGASTGERDLIAERLAYAEGRGPKPSPDPPRPLAPEVANLGRVNIGASVSE